MNNLYLIGIMGCGKTTVGKKAAKILGSPFFDLDREVEKKEGLLIREIFEKNGESAFRALESKVLADLSHQREAVISTGGGIILMQKNVDQMKATGTIIWIRRPVEDIIRRVNTNVRPLIKDNPKKLFEIYAEREPLYQQYADITIDNTKGLNEAAEAIAMFGRT